MMLQGDSRWSAEFAGIRSLAAGLCLMQSAPDSRQAFVISLRDHASGLRRAAGRPIAERSGDGAEVGRVMSRGSLRVPVWFASGRCAIHH